ncbi:hypothetical protein DL770_002641 [Monosporascus sp. CRB-9-2]|nr:hypothetical protein DL770_002641 [Monosporascus sp. CRB-9-2]
MQQDLGTDWPGCHDNPSLYWPSFRSDNASNDPEWGTCAYRIPAEDPRAGGPPGEDVEDRDIPDAAFPDPLKHEDFVNWPLPEDTSVLWTIDGAAEQDVQ